jgi:hypothetical protein
MSLLEQNVAVACDFAHRATSHTAILAGARFSLPFWQSHFESADFSPLPAILAGKDFPSVSLDFS